MTDYTGLNEEEAHEERRFDRGRDWGIADLAKRWGTWYEIELTERLVEALHDRDRYHRDAEYWREECIKLTWETLS